MISGQDLVDAAVTFVGQRYSTAAGRDDPDSAIKDCSGTIAAAYRLAYRWKGEDRYLGANVSVTIYGLAERFSLQVPRDTAVLIAGSCPLMPENPYLGWGDAGHIGFFDGNGGTVEATPPRVQRLSATYQPWGSHACLLPGVDYTNAGNGSTITVPAMEDDMRLIKRAEDEVWFLFTSIGWEENVAPARVWNLAAAGIPTCTLSGGDLFALGVSIQNQRKALAEAIKG